VASCLLFLMKTISLEQLKKYNGFKGRKAYIAYRGLIYDVTGSFLWKDGKHQVTHFAGMDHTDSLCLAPHGEEFLLKFPVVGRVDKKKV
jgi:predicted heme/steroid binding protein